MIKKLLMCTLSASLLLGFPVSLLAEATNEVEETVENEMSEDEDSYIVYSTEEAATVQNFRIIPEISEGLEAEEGVDVYRIAYKGTADDSRYLRMNISVSDGEILGHVDAGLYLVRGISYLGSRKALKSEPAATPLYFRVYNDQVTDFTIAIGEEAVSELEEEMGLSNIYKATDVASSNGNTGAIAESGLSNVDIQSPFVDESTFKGDEEARQEYIDKLVEQGLMNEEGELTEDGLAIKAQLEEAETTYAEAYAAAVAENEELADYLATADDSEAADITDSSDNSSADETESSSSQPEADSDVKETRYDNDTEEEEESTSLLLGVIRSTPYFILLIGILFIAYRMYKTKV